MPSVAERPPLPQGKKRRRDDDSSITLLNNVSFHHSSSPLHPHAVTVGPLDFKSLVDEDIDIFTVDSSDPSHQRWHARVPRRIVPLPASKRQRVVHVPIPEDDGLVDDGEQRERRVSSVAITAERERSRVLQDQTDAVNRPVTRASTKSLAPCNVCHRRPTKKSELDSYADCEGCGQRTCFICMRQCAGWLVDGTIPETGMEEDMSLLSEQEVLSTSFHMDDAPPVGQDEGHGLGEEHQGEEGGQKIKGWAAGGHRGMVCSRCCIEKGAEGDIVCLGCLARMEGV
jgi:cytochrome c553